MRAALLALALAGCTASGSGETTAFLLHRDEVLLCEHVPDLDCTADRALTTADDVDGVTAVVFDGYGSEMEWPVVVISESAHERLAETRALSARLCGLDIPTGPRLSWGSVTPLPLYYMVSADASPPVALFSTGMIARAATVGCNAFLAEVTPPSDE